MAKKSPIFHLVDSFSSEFEGLSKKLIPLIQKNINAGMVPRVAVNNAFRELGVSKLIRDSILEKIVTATSIGYSSGVIDVKGMKSTILSSVWSGDSLKLSDRIAKKEYQNIIVSNVVSEFNKKTTFNKLAQRLTSKNLIQGDLPDHLDLLIKKSGGFDPEFRTQLKASIKQINRLALNGSPNKTLKAQYLRLVKSIEKGTDKQFKKNLSQAIKEKARYNAERIARTEIARAYGAGEDLKNSLDNDVIGIRFSLSTRHPNFDVCDLHTNANLYGMGKGVYPKNHRPAYPFHPHCLCVISQVFRGETTKGKFDKNAGQSFINRQSKSNQEKLLGVRGRKDWKKGKNWQKTVNNYNGQEKVKLILNGSHFR